MHFFGQVVCSVSDVWTVCGVYSRSDWLHIEPVDNGIEIEYSYSLVSKYNCFFRDSGLSCWNDQANIFTVRPPLLYKRASLWLKLFSRVSEWVNSSVWFCTQELALGTPSHFIQALPSSNLLNLNLNHLLAVEKAESIYGFVCCIYGKLLCFSDDWHW